jgi:hypothetical protein
MDEINWIYETELDKSEIFEDQVNKERHKTYIMRLVGYLMMVESLI